MKFSERFGKKVAATAIQSDGIDDSLRNSLWNVLDLRLWSKKGFLHAEYGNGFGSIEPFSKMLWFHFFKKPMDTRPDYATGILGEIRKHFFGCEWYEVYDFIEFVLGSLKNPDLSDSVNQILERELAGYRYVAGCLVPVTSEQEIASLEEALDGGPFKGVSAHMQSAVEHLSRRQNPDYRNSIKESISAVESLAKELTGDPKATLGDALNILEKGGKIHPAFKKALSALYGYTSDESGIRHAMLEEPNLSAADAKFLLVACAAFVNYLKAKS